ncbi:MAG: tyrosine-type recombinase/integrase [Bacillota bacterium]
MGNYHEEIRKQEILHLRAIQKELPPFLREFFAHISQKNSTKTALGYAYDLSIFFRYLYEEHPVLGGVEYKELKAKDLELITVGELDIFLEYLSYYIRTDKETPEQAKEMSNENSGKSRKIAAIRSMYKFFVKREKIEKNPAALIELPKIHEKTIVRLEVNEVVNFLDEVETGTHLTKHQKHAHERHKTRDLALTTLFLGTGIRISECVGINIEDIDFENNAVKIRRKGGKEAIVYFGSEVEIALKNYIAERENLHIKRGNEEALFISAHGKRINPRSVQNLVKKYSQNITPKKISPHKLRSTFATNLYQETGDIYLVAETIGHSDVNVTKKHYAAQQEEAKRKAVKFIKLRED